MTIPTVLSLQVGLPATHGADIISDKSWTSGIVKQPVDQRVWLDTLNFAGDGQDDLKNHGGPFRAVLAYSADHYPIWQQELALHTPLNFGQFGENLTVSGVDEDTVCLGDVYAVGETRIQVTQPRQPCWKLARRNGIKDLAARVDKKGWGGWYHRVLQVGYIQAGDVYTLLERPYPQYPIKRMNDFIHKRASDVAAFREIATIDALTPEWRAQFAHYAEQSLA